MRRARWKRKNVRRVGLRRRRPPAAGGGWLAVPCGGQGRKRAALGETSSPGKSGIHPAPLFAAAGPMVDESLLNGPMRASAPTTARGARSEAERAERGTGQMRPCNPIFVGARAAGICRQIYTAPRRARRGAIANPQAPSRADPRRAAGRCALKRFFSLDRARPVSLLARPKEKWGVHCPAINIADSSVQWDAPQHPPAGYPHTRHSLCKRRSS